VAPVDWTVDELINAYVESRTRPVLEGSIEEVRRREGARGHRGKLTVGSPAALKGDLGYVRRLLVLHPKKGVAMPPTTTPSPPPRTST
jgi:hypothetical protein